VLLTPWQVVVMALHGQYVAAFQSPDLLDCSCKVLCRLDGYGQQQIARPLMHLKGIQRCSDCHDMIYKGTYW
jgi:hypothetical protein